MRNRALLAALAVSPFAIQAQEPPRFPSGVEQVVVDVVVLGPDGRPVTGLTQRDFEISEEGKPQAISSFTRVDAPAEEAAAPEASRVSVNTDPDPAHAARLLALVFDEQHLAPSEAEAARRASRLFVGGLAPGDRLYLAATGSGAAWSAVLPQGMPDVLAVLARMQGLRRQETGPDWISDSEAQLIAVQRDKRTGSEVMRRFMDNGVISDQQLPPPRDGDTLAANTLVRETMGEGHPMVRARATQVWENVKARRRATLAVLKRTLDGLATRRGRKTVLLVSAGFLHDTTDPDFARVQEAARRANAVIYFVDARVVADSGTSTADLGRAIDLRDVSSTANRSVTEVTGADSVAVESGGERIGTAATLADTLGRIADQGRAYYLLGYQPQDQKRDGRYRTIGVRVARTGVTVQARPGYYALAAEAPAAPDTKDTLPPGVQRALFSPFGSAEVPLRMTSFVLGPLADGRSRVVLVGEADPRALGLETREGRAVGSLDVYLTVIPRDGSPADTQQSSSDLSWDPATRAQMESTWLPLRRPRDLAPGIYEARLAVRDRASGHVGSVVHAFEVPEATIFRISTPILTDGALTGDALIARRSFAPGSRLSLQFEVQGAALDADTGAPRVRVSQELYRAGEEPSEGGEPTLLAPAPDGRLGAQLALPAPQPGPAEWVIRAKDEVSGKSAEVREAFTIDATAAPPR